MKSSFLEMDLSLRVPKNPVEQKRIFLLCELVIEYANVGKPSFPVHRTDILAEHLPKAKCVQSVLPVAQEG
jgi:hypothetical protein